MSTLPNALGWGAAVVSVAGLLAVVGCSDEITAPALRAKPPKNSLKISLISPKPSKPAPGPPGPEPMAEWP